MPLHLLKFGGVKLDRVLVRYSDAMRGEKVCQVIGAAASSLKG